MEVSNNFNRYDSTIQANNVQQKPNLQNSSNTVKRLLEAFRVDLSSFALNSKEFNDPSISFPVHNSNVLQYSEKLDLIFKS